MTQPAISVTAQRIYDRLPEIYRTLDVDQGWTLARYLDAVCDALDDIVALSDDILGARPSGPSEPVPWAMPADELAAWQASRTSMLSTLGDPLTAEPAWLPWLASLVGAQLESDASVEEQRDTIRYATSGWRAGTRGAIADAAKSALTGTRYAAVLVHTKVVAGSLTPGSAWEITIVTRSTETPDVNAVLGAVVRKGVKPAGVVLYHKAYSADWTTVLAPGEFPTWAQWNSTPWGEIQEAGM